MISRGPDWSSLAVAGQDVEVTCSHRYRAASECPETPIVSGCPTAAFPLTEIVADAWARGTGTARARGGWASVKAKAASVKAARSGATERPCVTVGQRKGAASEPVRRCPTTQGPWTFVLVTSGEGRSSPDRATPMEPRCALIVETPQMLHGW